MPAWYLLILIVAAGGSLVIARWLVLWRRAGATESPVNSITLPGTAPPRPPAPAATPPGPQPSLRRDRILDGLRQVLYVAAVVFAIRYLVWRGFSTIPPQALWFFVLFLAAEIFGFLETALFYFTNWKMTHHQPRPPLGNRAVDVYITTYDEPVHIVRETAVCAVHMRYPHRTYILDDGNRAEMKALADELHCDYISRTDHSHAKAGNLNNALRNTHGEFVVLLDADHVPTPNLIEETIGFFADEKVAAVQTPQDFYNLDSFQHETDWKQGYAWQQQELFFSVIEPGKDYWNAALFCGSPAMVRRSALEQIGGFAIGTITEDFHTSVRLQAKGHRVLYFNRTLARGLAPQTFGFFVKQWQRWGLGAMQILRQDNPLFRPGLSVAQKLHFFASMYFYWMSYQKLIYIFTPIFSLVSGIFPLQAEIGTFWSYFGPFFLLNLLASTWIYRGIRGLLLTEQFSLIKLHVMMLAVLGFRSKERKFEVTPKTQGSAGRLLEVWPQVVIAAWAGIAMVFGLGRLPGSSGFRLWAVAVSLFWAFYFLALSVPVVRRALKKRELRIAYRFGSRIDVPVVFSSRGSDLYHQKKGFARNMNRHGFSLTLDQPIPIGTLLEVEVRLPAYHFPALGRVVRHDEFKLGKNDIRFMNGFKFEQISPQAQDEISKFLFTIIAPQQGLLLRMTAASQSEPELQPGEVTYGPRK